MKVGDIVFPTFGPYQGKPLKVTQVDDPYEGVTWFWVSVELPTGEAGMYSNDELRLS